MRNRELFGPIPFDSYRGRDWNIGAYSSNYLYGAPSRHRDSDSAKIGSSDFGFEGPIADHDHDRGHNQHYYRDSNRNRPQQNYTQNRDYNQYGDNSRRSDYNDYRSSHNQNRDYQERYRHENQNYNNRERDFNPSENWESRDNYLTYDPQERIYGFNQDHDRPNHNDKYGHRRDWSERASDEVQSWFGDDEAARRRERFDRDDRRSW